MSTYTRKIGTNRGRPRLWLEGAILSENGFKHGDRWDISIDVKAAMIITLSEKGKRKIAGTESRPIIDIIGGAIEAVFDVSKVKKIKVEVLEKGSLKLTAIMEDLKYVK